MVEPPQISVDPRSGLKFAKIYRNLLKSTKSVPNQVGYAKIWLNLDEIRLNLDEISLDLDEISLDLDEISKRSSHFSTNRTKMTGETLPSVENDYFSSVI